MATSAPVAPVYLMSPPRPDWALRGRANVFAEKAESPAADAARADWLRVAQAIEAAGGVVAVVKNDDDASLTGLPYCAEAGVVAGDREGDPIFLLPRLTPPHRQGEPSVVASAMRRLGMRTVEAPGKGPFEGQGDVLWLDDILVVCTWGSGKWARTSRASAEAAAPMIKRRPHFDGRERDKRDVDVVVAGFRADPWFHGNTFLGGYHSPDGTQLLVLACREAFLEDGWKTLCAAVGRRGGGILPLTVEDTLTYPTNALQVGKTVLAPDTVGAVIKDAWRDLGLDVVTLPLPALFGRGGGAAVCLTNHLVGVDPARIPEDMRLARWDQPSDWVNTTSGDG